MAQGNYYAPLYSSLEARGRMSPLGAPGAIKPYEKKKSFGDKMAGALGDMIDQSMESRDAQEKEQIAQLEVEHKRLGKLLSNGEFQTVATGPNRGAQGKEVWVWNKEYKGDKSITPTPNDWNSYFAVKGQLGKRKGSEKYKDRKPSAFDYQFTETAKPASTGIFGNAFRSIMGI